MDTVHQDELVAACRAADDLPGLFARALPLVRSLARARSVAVVRRRDGALEPRSTAGVELPVRGLDLAGATRETPAPVDVPDCPAGQFVKM